MDVERATFLACDSIEIIKDELGLDDASDENNREVFCQNTIRGQVPDLQWN